MTAPAAGWCVCLAPPNPLSRSGAGTNSLRVSVAATMKLIWSDSATDTYTPGTHGACLSVYSGTPAAVDGSTLVWLVVASHGTNNLWLVKETDAANIATLMGAIPGVTAVEWAPLYRVDGDTVEKVSQPHAGSSVIGVGTAAAGDMLYYDGTNWVFLPLPGSNPAAHFQYFLEPDLITNTPAWVQQALVPGGVDNGDILFWDSTNGWDLLHPPTSVPSGQDNFLTFGSGSAPAWRDYYVLPPASVGSGHMLYSNGSSWINLAPPSGSPASGKKWVVGWNGSAPFWDQASA